MNLRLFHRRLAVGMGIAGLLAFAGGAGFEPVTTVLAFLALVAGLFWHPDAEWSRKMERVWLPLATLLVLRALFHVFVIRGDVVIPVVDLLLLLMAAEALRTLEAPNDLRIYALSFALILAATAYRPGILFLIGFVAYVGLATVAVMVGHLRRGAERHGVREVPLGRGLVGTTAGLSVVVLAVAAVVFVTFPRVSQGFAGRGETLASSIAGFSDEVSIGSHGSTIAANPEIVLRVEFPEGVPPNVMGLRWRGRSFDHFDGVRWTRSRGLPPAAGPRNWYRERWEGPVVEQRIFGAPLDSRVLFALHPALDIFPDNGIQPLVDNAGDFVYWGAGAPNYTVVSPAAPPTAEALRGAEEGFTPSERHFLQLPSGLDPAIVALADSLTDGLERRYDRVVAIERFLRGFQYTRELPATAAQTSLEYFLFERRAGHCEYFSTAMVVMLRAIGIEARNVNGFLGGQWNQFGNYLVVTQNEAHSWVEAWFPGYGWVTFDPTPAGSGGGSVTASWFWPGRILFDGIQHRWSKWVLDYGTDDQASLLSRWSEFLTGDGGGTEEGSTGTTVDSTYPWTLPLVLAFAAMIGWFWHRREAGAVDPASRLYLALRSRCARAGVVVTPGLTAEDLLAELRLRAPSAAESAALIVDLYQRARWGGEALGPTQLQEMQRALDHVRARLRDLSEPPRMGVRGARQPLSS